MIFDLAKDYTDALAAIPREHPKRRTLELFEEAIRREIHFIDRHPTTLFQCMWNLCWWYDCSDVELFHDRSNATDRDVHPRDVETGMKLSDLLRSWRFNRKSTNLMTPWCRALYPPSPPLGTGQIMTMRFHQGWGVSNVSYSPDGKMLVSSSSRSAAALWDVDSGRLLHTFPYAGHNAFSPDSQTIAFGSSAIQVCNAESGKLEACIQNDAMEGINSLTFSPDGSLLASGHVDGTVRIWEVRTGQEQHCLQVHTAPVPCVAFSYDGRRLASGSVDKSVTIIAVQSGLVLRRIEGFDMGVHSVAFSKQGERLLVGCYQLFSHLKRYRSEHFLSEWDSNSGQVHRWYPEESFEKRDGVESAIYSPNGKHIYCTANDRIYGWNVTTGSLEHVFQLEDGISAHSIAVSPSGSFLATGCLDGSVRVWDVRRAHDYSPCRLEKMILGKVVYSPDSGQLACQSAENTIILLDTASARERIRLQRHDGRLNDFACSPNGSLIVTASGGDIPMQISSEPVEDNLVRVWSAIAGDMLLRLRGHEGPVKCVTFSPDGGRILSGSDDGTLRFWSTGSGAPLGCIQTDMKSVSCVVFSPDGSRIVSAFGETICAWEGTSFEPLWRVRVEEPGSVRDVAFTPEGNSLVVFVYSSPEFRLGDFGYMQLRDGLSGHLMDTTNVMYFAADASRRYVLLKRAVAGEWSIADARNGELVAYVTPPFNLRGTCPMRYEWIGVRARFGQGVQRIALEDCDEG